MLWRIAVAAMGVTVLSASAQGQTAARPLGPPPSQTEVSFQDDSLIFDIYIAEAVRIPKKRTVMRDGKQIDETYDETSYRFVKKTNMVKAKEVTIYRANGTTLGEKDLARIFEKPIVVFLCNDDKKLDPFYLQFLDGEAIIMLLPPRRLPSA